MKNRIQHTTAKLITGALFAAAVLAPCAAAAGADDAAFLKQTSKAFSAIAKKAIPAVVFIKVEKTMGGPGRRGQDGAWGRPYYYDDMPEGDLFDFFLRDRAAPRAPGRFRVLGQGTGFIISKDGFILTNNHIVGDADKITVKLHDGREFEAENIGSDPRSEVAVIRIKGENLPFLEPGDSEAIEIGEWAIAIGNPFGLSETLTVGVISAKGRNNLGLTDYEDFIQTDAAINPGNSGGPLLNVDGKVIGMSTAIFSQTGGSLGIGFAIPINMAMAIKDQLVAGGKVTRGFLGILMQDLTPDIAVSMGLKQTDRGVIVVEVMRGSVAEKAGLKQGDIIVALEGNGVRNANILRNQVAMLTPGKSVKMKIIRNGAEMDLTVVVGSQSETADASAPSPASEQIGISVENLDQAPGEHPGAKAHGGVVVSAVRPDSPAHRAGIVPGNLICNINRRPVGSVEDYNSALAAAEETGLALILVRDREGARFLTIRLK